MPFSFIFRSTMLPDKDQDGDFRWVDKTEITFSNYGPGWPINTKDSWDCGQIFTGRICHSSPKLTLPCLLSWRWHCKTNTSWVYALFQEIMKANGKQPPASRAWVTFVRWQVDRTPNRLQLLVSQTSCSLFTYCPAKAVLIIASFFASDSHCDAGYLLYGDFCYQFETESLKSWQDAETHCTREQAHLASFHSPEELSFLIGEQLRKHSGSSNYHETRNSMNIVNINILLGI